MLKRPRTNSASPTPCAELDTNSNSSSHKTKKLKLQNSLANESPFPAWDHPTPSDALKVYNALCDENQMPSVVRQHPKVSTDSSAQSCGDVPNVIEALISTVLSQNTSAKNSTRAKENLDTAFGRNNFAAIAKAPLPDIIASIRSGGLANKKAVVIQKALQAIERKHGSYSLQHLASTDPKERKSDAEIMEELISYDGVGPKTAACVLLFCLGRDSFAVDTHVFRLSKFLGWVPPKADRVRAQAHLDLRVPNHLKYGLHVLMIKHGRVCKGCKTADSQAPCTLRPFQVESSPEPDGHSN